MDKKQVVAAAISQIDEKGLAAFSLRELARALGVSPAVIYWHVGGAKEDLFAEISASITGALSDGLDADMPWDVRLRQVFLNYRKLVHRHPEVAPLLGAQMQSNGVANLDWVETILSALQDGGYRGDALRLAFNVLVGGLAGFVTMELAPAPGSKRGSDSGSWQTLFAERIAQIDPQVYPLTSRALPDISNRIFVLRWQNGVDVSYGDSFELLLDLLIDGLRARAPADPI
ncbi:TetR/AcrR family transcriptional regulator [Pseudodonghicola xiamenensis]|uniref:Putative transcriptional regulator, TetR family (Tetracyclin resistance) n=1 Tax=Pseudodonghicola xiamenensis TaxID=337702 RepID=A0A8J3H7P1_9RHOB|nr:TetR/AcrR family transcriptional regulator [Pseudodonghicola xiamenensis]GHG97222.1 putative transcriptional regulator, TetR family (tetracyclin resistance) [Pseudodonghicola xiamenensis]